MTGWLCVSPSEYGWVWFSPAFIFFRQAKQRTLDGSFVGPLCSLCVEILPHSSPLSCSRSPGVLVTDIAEILYENGEALCMNVSWAETQRGCAQVTPAQKY